MQAARMVVLLLVFSAVVLAQSADRVQLTRLPRDG